MPPPFSTFWVVCEGMCEEIKGRRANGCVLVTHYGGGVQVQWCHYCVCVCAEKENYIEQYLHFTCVTSMERRSGLFDGPF